MFSTRGPTSPYLPTVLLTTLTLWLSVPKHTARVSAFTATLHDATYLRSQTSLSSSSSQDATESSARAALARTAAHLERLQRQRPSLQPDNPQDPLSIERETLYISFIQQSANSLKELLRERRLSDKGRKPDLANRLVAYELYRQYGTGGYQEEIKEVEPFLYEQDKMGDALRSKTDGVSGRESGSVVTMPPTFAGLHLSSAAHSALERAGFVRPTPIQTAAIPPQVRGESLILHAQTGSGKTIAYLLPITEYLWKTSGRQYDRSQERVVVLLPTRELAAQVAGVAMELAPPGDVRLVTHPVHLLRPTSQLMQDGMEQTKPPRLYIASAKTLMVSLYGDDQMPAPPTSKPEAVEFLKSIRVCVLDEVDRLLGVTGHSKYQPPSRKRHERPAAIVTAAVARYTLGRAQMVAASATVGRPLKRELARVLGLLPKDCPRVVRSVDSDLEDMDESAPSDENDGDTSSLAPGHVGRAVTIPASVTHYSVIASGSSDGDLLTAASRVIQSLQSAGPCRKLLVLSRGFGISTTNTIGALSHFGCQPMSLLDALEADTTMGVIERHRAVSLSSGVGQSLSSSSSSSSQPPADYLLVTGEDSVRGLHLDQLDCVIVVGRPKGPDEYCHIAGRTGRAGRSGFAINVVNQGNAQALSSWETMLQCQFHPLEACDAGALLPAPK